MQPAMPEAGAERLNGRRRILVIGSGGSGKSTFARALGERTGLPVVHLDRFYWRPGWVPTPEEEWLPVVSGLIAADTWIMDGNFGGTLEARLCRCDAVVFFDMPRITCIRGVLKRWIAFGGRTRPELPEGCGERFDLAFLSWVWTYPERSRPRVLDALGRLAGDVPVVTLRSHAKARDALASVIGAGA